jgi:vacuole morphology and inheritance protein 14
VNVVASSRSKLGREDIKWQDLFAHFRSVQAKHEKARRVGLGGNPGPLLDGYSNGTSNANRPPSRRRVTGDASMPPPQAPSRAGALSPLNPRARVGTGNNMISGLGASAGGRPSSPNLILQQQRTKRGLSLTRK